MPFSPFVAAFVATFVERIGRFIGSSTKFATKMRILTGLEQALPTAGRRLLFDTGGDFRGQGSLLRKQLHQVGQDALGLIHHDVVGGQFVFGRLVQVLFSRRGGRPALSVLSMYRACRSKPLCRMWQPKCCLISPMAQPLEVDAQGAVCCWRRHAQGQPG